MIRHSPSRAAGPAPGVWARHATLALLCAVVLPWHAAFGAQELDTGPQHRGLVTFGDFQVFPERRVGNGVYLNNRLVLSLPTETVVYIVPLPKPGRMVYLARGADGKTRLGAALGSGDPEPRVTRLTDNTFFAVMVLDGVVYKKVYRVADDDTVADLLPSSKTADGITVGAGGLLFYNVASVNKEEQGGKQVTTFSLRLHLLRPGEEILKNLAYPIVNQLPKLDLEWIDENRIRYRLADGRDGALSVSQFQ